MRRLHALAAGAVEYVRRRGIERDGKDVGAEVPGLLHVLAGHRRRVRQYRDGNRVRVDAIGPLFEHRERIVFGARVRDHRNAHAVERAVLRIRGHDIDDFAHRHGGPVDADEVAVRVVPVRLPVAGQTAIGAVCAATFRVGEQQVETARALATVHAPAHDAERDRGSGRQLHVLRRLHVRREYVVVRQVNALRRYVVGLDVLAVAAVHRRLFGESRLHGLERVVVALPLGACRCRRGLLFNTAHRISTPGGSGRA